LLLHILFIFNFLQLWTVGVKISADLFEVLHEVNARVKSIMMPVMARIVFFGFIFNRFRDDCR